MSEIFKDIEGTSEYYQISNFGRVKSIKRKWVLEDIILTTIVSKSGYCVVNMMNLGKLKVGKIHRLVAQAFIPNPENKPEVNHKDGNKLNNHVSNLEWCTGKENMQHAYRTGLVTFSDEARRLGRESTKGQMYTAKKVIDISNGKIYPSILEASKDTDFKYFTLIAMIKGRNPNKSNMRFYEEINKEKIIYENN